MNRALLLVAGCVGNGLSLWLRTLRRPLIAEVAALRDLVEKLGAEKDLLRARLERINPHRALLHALRAASDPAPSVSIWALCADDRSGLRHERPDQSIVNWLNDVSRGITRVVRARRPLNRLPDLPTSSASAGPVPALKTALGRYPHPRDQRR